jgi:hypothetical protein
MFSTYNVFHRFHSFCFKLYLFINSSYPKTSCKIALAQNIVRTWPQLGQKTFPNKPYHFFLFNTDSSTISGRSKNGGLIENRIDNTMRKLPQDQKRYIKRKKTEEVVPIEQVVSHYVFYKTFDNKTMFFFCRSPSRTEIEPQSKSDCVHRLK